MNKSIQHIVLYIFCMTIGLLQNLSAQVYPVQVVPTVISPYSSKLSDYSNAMVNRINLQLISTDVLMNRREVDLRVKIQGNGISAQSRVLLTGVRPIYLNGGEIQSLSSSELATYFRYDNLEGISSTQYSNPLPDGVYTICFQVFDKLTQKVLSTSGCSTMYLMLNDPPLLNLPSNREEIATSDFPLVIFSWTPRQLNATNVSYRFELKELLDPTMDPTFAFEVSRPLYAEDDLRMTTLVYDINKPSLLPGKRYAWRVRAISTSGLGENSVFKNNGYSEVYSFTYSSSCSAPRFLLSEQQANNRVKIMWQGENTQQRYHVQYRKAGIQDAAWFDQYTVNTQSMLSNLEPGFTYEFRVGASCQQASYGVEPSFTYSSIQTFRLEAKNNSTTYNCGIVPDLKVTNQQPLGGLVINETFMAGDFPVKVLEVSGANGVFSGRGYIVVPYLFDTKIEVEFLNVSINTDYQLMRGVVETTYDQNWENVEFIDNLVDTNQQEITLPFPIADLPEGIQVGPGGDLVITGEDGRTETFPGGKDTVITDSTGQVYYIDKEGNVSGPTAVAAGGKPTPDNTDGVNKNGEVQAFTAKGISVAFESDEAFDAVAYNQGLTSDYKKISGNYLPFKAVVKGSSTTVRAKVTLSDRQVPLDSLVFKTSTGTRIDAMRIAGSDDFELTLTGTQSNAIEEIQASIKQGEKYKVAGAFKLVHLDTHRVNLRLVPTSDQVNLEGVIAELQAIYARVGVEVQATIQPVFAIDAYVAGTQVETADEKGDLSTYSTEQQRIITAYQSAQPLDKAYYIFVTDKSSSTGQQGYMRLNGQFGFVFRASDASTISRTIAHELGHGAFKLEHPFKAFQSKGLREGATNSLMDYGTTSTDFIFTDWKQMNDPKLKLYAFQGQSEGALGGAFDIAPNGKKVYVDAKTIYYHEGVYVPVGTLPGFITRDNVVYYWNATLDTYVNAATNEKINTDTSLYKEFTSFSDNDVITLHKEIGDCQSAFMFVHYKELKGLSNLPADLAVFFEENLDAFSQQHFADAVRKAGIAICTSKHTYPKGQSETREEGQLTESSCKGFLYFTAMSSTDKEVIKQALIKGFNDRKGVSSEDRSLGKFNHIQIVGDKTGAPLAELELLEDRLHLLSYYRPDVYVSVVFLQKDITAFYTVEALNKGASEIVKEAQLGKKTLLMIVPYGKTLNLKDVCVKLGYGQANDGDVVDSMKVNLGEQLTWDKNLSMVFAKIKKPLFINRYYRFSTNKWVSVQNRYKEVEDYPYIKTLNFYESKAYNEIKSLNKKWNKVPNYQNNWSLYQDYKTETDAVRFKYATVEESEDGLEKSDNWESISTEDFGKFREPYFDKIDLTNELWEKSKMQWAWGNKVELSFDSSGLKLNRNQHFYGFDRLLVVDDVVYGVADGLGMLPGIDVAGDILGMAYAGLVRQDLGHTIVYTASASVPFVGAAYVKGGLKAGEDASYLYGVVAKQADNVDGFILETKRIKDIQAGEVHVASVFYGSDKQLTDKVLAEVKRENKYVDNNLIRTELNRVADLKLLDNEAKNLILKTFGRGSQFAEDKLVINKVAEFLHASNKKALDAIGGTNGLEEIIKANVRAGCSTCGTASTSFLKNMDEYLDDVLYFGNTFVGKEGFDKVIKELKIVNSNGDPNYAVEGATFMLRKIRETPEITATSVRKFDGIFEGEIDKICLNCRFDIELVNGKKFEYKSYGVTSINSISSSETFLRQHLSYLEKTSSLDQIVYEFDKLKFSERAKIVEQFRKMYEKNAKDVFNSNPSLFKGMKDFNNREIRDWEAFKAYLSDKRFMSDNQLFDFIKN